MARQMQVSRVLGLVLVAGLAARVGAQVTNPEGSFTLIKNIPAEIAAMQANARPDKGVFANVHWDVLRPLLATAPAETDGQPPVTITLPTPDGNFARFTVHESSVMEPGLAQQFPDIKTFVGQGVDDPYATVRLDHTQHGFHAQVLTPDGTWFVDPVSWGDASTVASFYKRDLPTPPGRWQCDVNDAGEPVPEFPTTPYQPRVLTTLKTFRLAVSCTGEYAVNRGGTVAAAQAAIVTVVNRVTGIYENELGARLSLVANNTNVVFTNAATDPYANSGGSGELSICNAQCNSLIGTANYDIGHVFETSDGGIASLNSVCSSVKGQGLSGLPTPVGDAFAVDYVAHEMGHQFGGRHCFNSCGGGAGDAFTYAYEPGSGSTIMAYAGICGTDDLQAHSDAMFHSGSFDLMRPAITSSFTCRSAVSTTNNAPTVNAGADYTIPRSTPFILTATGADTDGDPLTYSWEQRSTGTVSVPLPITDNGSNPIVRTRAPSTSPSRMVPPLANVRLGNTAAVGEILPTTGRTMPFRVVVRDNQAGEGGIGTDDMVVTVVSTAGPFTVTAPNTAVSWSGTQTVTWSVASTNVAPINCANVKISLSTDNGATFPTVLLASTPNDGSQAVTLPNISTTQARIKVEAVGNIFFDMSNAAFTITPAAGVSLSGSGVNTASDAAPNGNNNGVIEPGESSVGLTVQVRNSGGATATGVSATLTSLTPTVSIVQGSSPYANLVAGGTGNNTAPYVISVAPNHVCGAAINLRLSISSAQGTGTYDFSLPTGTTTGPSTQTFSYTGPAVAITDNTVTGVNVPLTVSGYSGTVSDLDFRFDGATCSATAGSTTVGLDHTYVGDLIVTLTAPGGSPSAILIDRPGYPTTTFGIAGVNFCQMVMDDEGSLGPIEVAAAASNPFTGSWTPNNPLSVFDGINPNGTWTLNVSDNAAQDTGSVRAFSLVFNAPGNTTCQPPLGTGCDPDVNQDGNSDQGDVDYLINVIAGGDNPTGIDPDFNHDGNADQADVDALIDVIAGGDCP